MMDFKSEAEKLLEQLVMDWQAEMPMGRPIPADSWPEACTKTIELALRRAAAAELEEIAKYSDHGNQGKQIARVIRTKIAALEQGGKHE